MQFSFPLRKSSRETFVLSDFWNEMHACRAILGFPTIILKQIRWFSMDNFGYVCTVWRWIENANVYWIMYGFRWWVRNDRLVSHLAARLFYALTFLHYTVHWVSQKKRKDIHDITNQSNMNCALSSRRTDIWKSFATKNRVPPILSLHGTSPANM